jgi:hypothetical protein
VLARNSICVANISAGIFAEHDPEFRELINLCLVKIVQYPRQGPMEEIGFLTNNGTEALITD